MGNLDNPDSLKESGKHKRLIVTLAATFAIAVITLVCAVLVAFTVIRKNVQTTSLSIPLLADEGVNNQIAFTGNDSNLWLVSPNGTNLRRLTTDGKGYRFPTWAPNGRHLAFIGPNSKNDSALYISPVSREAPTIIFNEPNSDPFYLYWAPDSSAITFLTQETSNLAMRLIDAHTPNMQRILGEGTPFYWVWSPQSDKMLLHVGGSRAVADDAHISLLDNQKNAQRVELNLAPGQFQAPVWSFNGDDIFYIAANDNGENFIFKTDASTLESQKVTNLGGFAHVVLSPDDKNIAYLQIEKGISPPFGKAYRVDVDGKNKQQIMESPVASMYWSPDGKKLALLGLSRQQEGPTAKIDGLAAPLSQRVTFRWWVYHVDTEELEPIISFTPTNNFLQTIPYFDQYYLSLTFWSPDSRYLVVTKSEDDDKNNGSVWVVDTTGRKEPLEVGKGSLAVWSWQ